MQHHAFYYSGNLETGVKESYAYAKSRGLNADLNGNVITLRHTNLSVDETRRIIDLSSQAPTSGSEKIIIITAARLFHEAQNALLKLFEEPTAGTTLILVVTSEGVLLPTLRSRLLPLPQSGESVSTPQADAFLALTLDEQRKFLERLHVRSRADKPEEKQEARREALELVQELTQTLHKSGDPVLLADLVFFARILHERSTPLKPVFEHLLLVLGEGTAVPRARV